MELTISSIFGSKVAKARSWLLASIYCQVKNEYMYTYILLVLIQLRFSVLTLLYDTSHHLNVLIVNIELLGKQELISDTYL